jgi:hypothetical protein
MLVLIYEGAIAGITEQAEGLPSGFEAVEAPDLPLEQLFWDGKAVVEKPSQPSPAHVWDSEQNAWIAPIGSEPLTLEEAITQTQQRCLNYWAGRIAALTAGYPDTEVAKRGSISNRKPIDFWHLKTLLMHLTCIKKSCCGSLARSPQPNIARCSDQTIPTKRYNSWLFLPKAF